MKETLRRIKSLTGTPRNKSEEKLLTIIGQKINKDLYKLDKPVEWLSWESRVARSTIQRITSGNGNLGILTLDRIAKGLSYKGVLDFLSDLKK